MTLPPGRFDYAPINDRPIIKWPNNARVAFWVAPNMEFFEYLPENRPTQPDIPHYSRMDYGNRVGFWRMLDVLNKHKLRACCCLNLEILDHFPEIKDAMIAADWDYMAHGLYNSRPIYDLTEEEERAYWQDFIGHLKEMTGKRLNGRVMCLSLHPHNIGRPNAAKHLDEALRYILGHDGVWATTADDIAEYYLANYYDQVKSWITERKIRVAE